MADTGSSKPARPQFCGGGFPLLETLHFMGSFFMDEFVVYVLASNRTDRLYKGYTSNLIERMKSHNSLGSGWTKRYRPWTVVHIEFYTTKGVAMAREKWFKSTSGRRFIRDFLKIL